MKPGGGRLKGAGFERQLCVALSQWLTRNKETNIFVRNVTSGGRFTMALARNKTDIDLGQPGDVMAGHPLATRFTDMFAVEAKFWKDLGLPRLFTLPLRYSPMGEVYLYAKRQASAVGKLPLVVAKQNQLPSLVFGEPLMAEAIRIASKRGLSPTLHLIHSGTLMVVTLNDLLHLVDPHQLMDALDAVNGRPTSDGSP